LIHLELGGVAATTQERREAGAPVEEILNGVEHRDVTLALDLLC
jgi:hypothetical protein